MSSLANSPDLTGFFCYAIDDANDDSHNKMLQLRERIYSELSAQLGRSRYDFRIWQDKGALPQGTVWQSEITNAIQQSAFFIPVITPRLIGSQFCRFELEAFLARERALGRSDLIFPIYYISVPDFEEPGVVSDLWHKIIRDRQYLDWRELRFADLADTHVSRGIAQLCRNIHIALRKPLKPTDPSANIGQTTYSSHDASHEGVRRTQERGIAGSLPARSKDDLSLQTAELKRLDEERLRIINSAREHNAEQRHRREPEYWLDRIVNERKLMAGDEPMVLISFASEDQAWIDELHAFLEPRIAQLRDIDGRSYHLWNFSDARRGTTPGDEFPEIVAEKMWRCRAAVLVLSRDYVRSHYCRHIELPFLMWRWEHHRLMCLPLKIGIVPIEKVRVPEFQGPARSVILDEIIDDRQAAADFARSPYRDRNLKELKEAGLNSEIEKRLDGLSRRMAEFLKAQYGAQDEY